MAEVSGQIVLPTHVRELPPGAVVRVSVQDVSYADASAAVAATSELRDVSVAGPIAFRLDVPHVDPNAQYSVRVHVDVDGSGEVVGGDLVSTQSHPVLTGGHRSQVSVPVQQV